MADMHVLPWNATTLAFLFAGKCWVSLESVLTGARFTYSVKQKVKMGYAPDPKNPAQQVYTVVERFPFWFVALQVGAIGEATPRYLGVIEPATGFRTTAKTASNPLATAENINMFGDVLRDLSAGLDRANQVRIWHCGKCGHCARALSVPSSIATGFGPDCAEKLGIEMTDTKPTLIEKIGALDEPTNPSKEI